MSYRRSFFFLTGLLGAACVPVFAVSCTITVTPEPSLGIWRRWASAQWWWWQER